jgi:hypothetical protein
LFTTAIRQHHSLRQRQNSTSAAGDVGNDLTHADSYTSEKQCYELAVIHSKSCGRLDRGPVASLDGIEHNPLLMGLSAPKIFSFDDKSREVFAGSTVVSKALTETSHAHDDEGSFNRKSDLAMQTDQLHQHKDFFHWKN